MQKAPLKAPRNTKPPISRPRREKAFVDSLLRTCIESLTPDGTNNLHCGFFDICQEKHVA